MKKNKIVYVMVIVVLLMVSSIANLNKSYAANPDLNPDFSQKIEDPSDGGSEGGSGTDLPTLDSFQPSIGLGGASSIIGKIVGILMIVGTVLIVVAIALIGFLTILGSASEKAEYKQKLVGVIFAGIFMVGSSSIAKLLIATAMDTNNSSNTGGTNQQVMISLDKTNVTLKIGENEEITLVATLPSGLNKEVHWITNKPGIATVDENGKVKAVGVGTARITASTGVKSVSCKVTVEGPEITSIKIKEDNITLNNITNKTYQLTTEVEPAKFKDSIEWSSSENKVATVNNGKVTAVGVGTATITAKYGMKSDTCQVTVEDTGTTSIVISEKTLTLNAPIEKTYQLTAKVTPSNSKDSIKWSSNNDSVAKVDSKGNVKAVGTGTATITAISGSKSDTCTVTVKSSRVYEIKYYNTKNHTVSSNSSGNSNDEIKFRLYIPEVSDVAHLEKLPLVIFLHGGVPNYGNTLIENDSIFSLKNTDYPAIFICPVAPSNTENGWNDEYKTGAREKLKGLIDYSLKNYNVDENKIALTGASNGGGGSWRMALEYPNLFSCIVLVSPNRNDQKITVYPDCPIRILTSTADGNQGPYEYLKNAGKQVKLELLGNTSHDNMPKKAYTQERIYWMIEQNR